MANTNVQIVLTAVDRASPTVKKVGRELDGLDGRGGVHGRPGVGTGPMPGGRVRSGMGVGTGMGLGALGGVGSLGAVGAGFTAVGAVRAAADYESALTGIQKKSGMAAAEVAALGEEAKALAISGRVAMPLDEILAGIERGAAMGIPKDDMMEFIELTAKAADAFEMSAEDVANASETMRLAFRMPREEVKELFDVVNSLADAGIASESDIINFLERSGDALRTFGQSKEEAAALGASLLNIGMPAEVASRAMNALTSSMLSPKTPKARKALNAIVGDVDKFQHLLRTDANGAMLMFMDSINELDKFQKAELLTSFVGSGWQDEVGRLAGGAEEFRRNLELAHNESRWIGSLDQAYNLKLDDFWSQWKVFENQLAVLSIDIGGAVMPSVVEGMNGLKNLAGEVKTGFDQLKLDIDWTSVSEASAAIQQLATQLVELVGMDTSKNSVSSFFSDMADSVNTTANEIKGVTDAIQWLKDQATGQGNKEEGIVDPTVQGPDAVGNRPITLLRDGGEWSENLGNTIRNLGDKFMAMREEVNKVAPLQSSNVSSAMYSPQSSIGNAAPLSFTPPAQVNVGALQEEAAQARAVIDQMKFETIAPNMDLETTMFFIKAQQAQAMLDTLGQSVMARADLDISPIIAKVAQARNAIASLESGGGNQHESNVRSQFSPVGAG